MSWDKFALKKDKVSSCLNSLSFAVHLPGKPPQQQPKSSLDNSFQACLYQSTARQLLYRKYCLGTSDDLNLNLHSLFCQFYKTCCLSFSLLYMEFMTQILPTLVYIFSWILQHIFDQRRCLSLNFRKENHCSGRLKLVFSSCLHHVHLSHKKLGGWATKI